MKKLALLLVIPLIIVAYEPPTKITPVTIVAEPLTCKPPVIEVEVIEIVEPESLGVFKLTAYCSCKKCCGKWADKRTDGIVRGATGEVLTAGYSVAVDPEVIPYGTEVAINGHTYKAMDCGGAIDGNELDIYFNDHNEALEFGVQYAEVFLNVEE